MTTNLETIPHSAKFFTIFLQNNTKRQLCNLGNEAILWGWGYQPYLPDLLWVHQLFWDALTETIISVAPTDGCLCTGGTGRLTFYKFFTPKVKKGSPSVGQACLFCSRFALSLNKIGCTRQKNQASLLFCSRFALSLHHQVLQYFYDEKKQPTYNLPADSRMAR